MISKKVFQPTVSHDFPEQPEKQYQIWSLHDI